MSPRAQLKWWPDKDFERQHLMPAHAARYEADAWEEDITTYLAGKTTTTIGEVAQGALLFDKSRVGRADQNRIKAALQQIGWTDGPRQNSKWP